MSQTMWRLRSQTGGFVVINPDAIDFMRPTTAYESGTSIILRGGRRLEVERLLGELMVHLKFEVDA